MKNENIIIILVVIIVILAGAVGLMYLQTTAAKPTELKITSNSTINEGDSIEIQLTDKNGTPLVNQSVNVTVTDENKTTDYHSVVTNENGVGTLNLDKGAGNYSILVSYGGDEKFNGANISQNMAIKAAKTSVSSSLPYSIDNLPPSNDPYPEVRRYQVNEYTVVQEYADHYRSNVDLRTGERNGGFF